MFGRAARRMTFWGILSALVGAGVLSPAADTQAQQAVTFSTVDEGLVSGDLYGDGIRGLVLTPGGRFDKSSWNAEARVLADAGFLVLSISLRGRGGSQAGTAGEGALYLDVLGAVEYLRSLGATEISAIGASLGGWAVAEAITRTKRDQINSVVLLAHSVIEHPEQLHGRKLFIVSREDTRGGGARRLAEIRDQYERAPYPKELLVLEGSAHAQLLFQTDQGEQLLRKILCFLSAPTANVRSGGTPVTSNRALQTDKTSCRLHSQKPRQVAFADEPSSSCSSCAEWNVSQHPFQVYGNTYYVGTHGLAAILVTSREGHVLIDGALPESAPQILANIQALGFRIQDVKVILNSHAHFDHAGGIAALQRASDAAVAASPASATVLERGASGPDDPQYGVLFSYPPVHDVRRIADGETVHVGPLALTAHFTPGHTHGGTSWSWRSCENGRCLEVVYADSQTPVSADGFRFTGSQAAADFKHGVAVLEQLRCDVLLTPHPGASKFWERVAARDQGEKVALIDPGACKRYAATARRQLVRRLASEAKAR